MRGIGGWVVRGKGWRMVRVRDCLGTDVEWQAEEVEESC